MLLLSVFLHIGTHKQMKDCLRHMAKAAINTWSEGRRALRALWVAVQGAAKQWNFKPSVSASVDSEGRRIMNICMNHNLMSLVFDQWDITGWFMDEPDDQLVEPSEETGSAKESESSAPPDTLSDTTGASSDENVKFTVVGHVNASDQLESLSVWASHGHLDVNEESALLCLCQEDSWPAVLSRLDTDVPLISTHSDRSKLLTQMEKYSLLGPDQVPAACMESV